ncbi:hypothetical protein ACJX0J_016118, partial [Zea mays]
FNVISTLVLIRQHNTITNGYSNPIVTDEVCMLKETHVSQQFTNSIESSKTKQNLKNPSSIGFY